MSSFFRPMNGIQWLTFVLVGVVAAGFIYGFNALASVQHHQNDALRAIMCHAERVVRTQPGIPPKQRREALHFYISSLRDAHLAPCE